MRPRWTVLVATLGQRSDRFRRLLDALLPQLEPYAGRVTVLAYRNNGERPLSHVRQTLVEHATSDYVSFVDDDDLVPPYHVDEVTRCLEDDVDYVGWRMQCVLDGVPLKPTFHSLRYDRWWDDDRGYYRDVSHLNPVRRELALRADFRRGDPPEDVSWADQLRGQLKTECYVDRVMYLYQASSVDSTWRPGAVQPGTFTMLDIVSPYLHYHPEST